MKPVKIADLKNNLSRHLDRVRRGHAITVLDRDTPIARIVPFVHGESPEGTEAAVGQRVSDLARLGLATPGDARAVAAWIEAHRPAARPERVPAASDVLIQMRRQSTR